MKSCIYEGLVSHTRTVPVVHRFRYRVFMMYLDLGELPELFERRWLWSARKPALARFRREDYLGPSKQPLDEAVRDLVEADSGFRPRGPVRLLTNLRYFGYGFNPVSYYYCFAADGETIEAFVAEVTNTPWGEKYTYVLPTRRARQAGGVKWFRDDKKMHVSPFMPMDMQYDWCFADPAEKLSVYMTNSRDNKRIFHASVIMKRTDICARSLARVLITFPFMTLKIIAAIHWQALRLWIKGCPIHAHPGKRQKAAATTQ